MNVTVGGAQHAPPTVTLFLVPSVSLGMPARASGSHQIGARGSRSDSLPEAGNQREILWVVAYGHTPLQKSFLKAATLN
ncbi:MAG: hypothetical protein VKL39_02410 [Leptolyngbyaceae bacterium]|nr:hypothetical protein [Leptolyngbyaceae bacterium]